MSETNPAWGGGTMTGLDTNVLVRALVRDDPQQAQTAIDALLSASLVAVALPSLCELVWVLRRVYGFGAGDAAAAIRALMAASNVQANRPAVDAGLAVLEAGGIGVQHLGDAGDLRSRLGDCGSAMAGDEHMDLAAASQRSGDGVEGGALEGAVVVFSHDEGLHSGAHVKSPWLRS